MKLTSLVPMAFASLALLLAGCGGPEGTYKLDKEAMKTAMKAEIEKMPKDQQGFGELGLALIEAMDITLEIKSGGKYDMKSSMPSLSKDKEKKEETESGDWSVEGDKIKLKGAKEELTCKLDSSKIECEGKEKGKTGFTFKKQ